MSRGWLYAWGLGSVAYGGASLVVPLYVVALGGDPFTLGLLAAAAAFVGVPGALGVGRLADRTGRRRAYVLVALALTAAALAVVPSLASIPAVIAANAAVWLAFAAATPALTLLAVADADPEDWSGRIALLNQYQGVGWTVGLLVGAVWTALGPRFAPPLPVLRWFLVLVAGVAVAAFGLGLRSFPPDPDVPDPTENRRFLRALRRANTFNVRAVTFPFTPGRAAFAAVHPGQFVRRFTPTLAAYFGAVVLVFTGFAAFFAPLPAYLTDAGFGSGETFALYLVSSVASAVLFGAVGRMAARHDVAVLQSAGLVVRGVVLVAVSLAGGALGASVAGLGAAGVAFVALGVTWAVVAVTAGTVVTALAPAGVRGEALGVYAALTALAGGVGSVLGGWLAAESYAVAFAASGALVILGAGVVFALRGPVAASRETASAASSPAVAEGNPAGDQRE